MIINYFSLLHEGCAGSSGGAKDYGWNGTWLTWGITRDLARDLAWHSARHVTWDGTRHLTWDLAWHDTRYRTWAGNCEHDSDLAWRLVQELWFGLYCIQCRA